MLFIKAFNTCAYPSVSLFLIYTKILTVGIIYEYTASLPSDESKVVAMAKHRGMKYYWSEKS